MEKSMDKAGKVVKQLAGSGTGQSLMDRVYSAKHTLAGSALGKCVCKATTEEIIAPKKKHTEYLVKCSSEPNVSIPQLADLVLERTKHQNWVVVFKSLISLHSMMNFGNERFCQYMASNNCTVNTENFADKSGTLGYDMSVFIRRYGKYLNCKIGSYRSMAFDFCKIKRGKDDGVLRTMSLEKLLLALPVLQRQLDELVAFDASPNELKNPVINAAFILLFKDLIRLFACYNDGIINLLERYFKLEKKQCRQALDLYKVFLSRMDKVGEFLKTAEKFGIDKEDIPDLAKAPASLLNALEHHLATLEGRTYEPPEENAANGANGAAPVEAPKEPQKKIISEPSVDLFSGDNVNSEPPKPPASTPSGPSLIEKPAESAPSSKPVDDLLGLFDSLSTPSAASPYQTGGLPASPTPIRPPPPSSIGGTSGTSTKSGSAYDELSDLFGGGTNESKPGMGLGDLTGFGTVPASQGVVKNEGSVSIPGLSMGTVGVTLSATSPISPSGNLSRPLITTSGLGGGSLLQPTAISPSASPQIMRTNQQKDRSSTLDLDDTLASLAGAIAGGKKTDAKWVGATSPGSQNKSISSTPKFQPPAEKTSSMSVNWGNSLPSPQPMSTNLGDNGQETGVMTAMSPPSPAHLGPQQNQLSKSQQELADLLM